MKSWGEAPSECQIVVGCICLSLFGGLGGRREGPLRQLRPRGFFSESLTGTGLRKDTQQSRVHDLFESICSGIINN